MKLLIPDSFSPQAYDILRALSPQFKKTIALIPEEPFYASLFCPAALSFLVDKKYPLSLPPEVNALSLALRTEEVKPIAGQYAKQVLGICREEGVSLIYPGSDDYVLLFSLFKNLFEEKGIEVAVGNFPVLCRLMDKRHVIDLANEAGLDVPSTMLASDQGWKQFPALIKPRFGAAGEGQHFVAGPKALAVWQKNNKNSGDFIIQEFIPGTRIVYLRLYNDIAGRLYAASFAENDRPLLKLHQTRALLLRSLSIPDAMLTRAAAMISALKFSGYCHFQMKIDQRDKSAKVMEVNARISRGTWSECSRKFNPVQASRMLISGNLQAQESIQRGDQLNALYIWPLQDVIVLFFLLAQWLRNFVKGLVGQKVARQRLPGIRSMVRHYRKTYLSRNVKRADSYTRHFWHDPIPGLAYGIVFLMNNFIKIKREP